MHPTGTSAGGEIDTPDLSPEQNAWVAACHEAAHAAVGNAAGGYVTRVSLEEQATYIEWGPVRPRHSYVLMLLSGYVAGNLTIPGCWATPGVVANATAELAIASLEGGPMPSSHNDTWLVAQEALSLFPGDRQAAERYIRRSAAKAESTVRGHWPLIEVVATSLLARGELSGDEFLMIIQ